MAQLLVIELCRKTEIQTDPKICRMSQKQETQEEPLFHFESKGRKKKKKKLMPSSEAGRQEDYPLTQVEGQPFVLFWPLTDWVRPTI